MVFRKIYAGIVRNCFLGINTPQYDCARPQTCSCQEFSFYDTIQCLSGFFHGAFQCLLLFTKKLFSHLSFRTSRLRYEINTTKTKLNKSLHFFDAGKVSVTVRQTIRACSVRKTTFRTRKRFATNNTRPNQKISCLNQSALIFT